MDGNGIFRTLEAKITSDAGPYTGLSGGYLRTGAGLKLCTPAALERLKAGNSAVNYFPGDRENGGVFKHANMMATAAMLKAAKQVKDETLAAALASLAFETIGFTG